MSHYKCIWSLCSRFILSVHITVLRRFHENPSSKLCRDSAIYVWELVVIRVLFLRIMCVHKEILYKDIYGCSLCFVCGCWGCFEFLPSDCDKYNLCPKPDQVYATDFYLCIENFFHRLTLFAHNKYGLYSMGIRLSVWIYMYI